MTEKVTMPMTNPSWITDGIRPALGTVTLGKLGQREKEGKRGGGGGGGGQEVKQRKMYISNVVPFINIKKRTYIHVVVQFVH